MILFLTLLSIFVAPQRPEPQKPFAPPELKLSTQADSLVYQLWRDGLLLRNYYLYGEINACSILIKLPKLQDLYIYKDLDSLSLGLKQKILPVPDYIKPIKNPTNISLRGDLQESLHWMFRSFQIKKNRTLYECLCRRRAPNGILERIVGDSLAKAIPRLDFHKLTEKDDYIILEDYVAWYFDISPHYCPRFSFRIPKGFTSFEYCSIFGVPKIKYETEEAWECSLFIYYDDTIIPTSKVVEFVPDSVEYISRNIQYSRKGKYLKYIECSIHGHAGETPVSIEIQAPPENIKKYIDCIIGDHPVESNEEAFKFKGSTIGYSP